MIVKLYKINPTIIYQTDNNAELPEPVLACSVTSDGLIIIQQETTALIINPGTVPELCKVLKELASGEKGRK